MQTATSLPHQPGVYRFLDNQKKILYVGKARDLKKRVSQYFQKNNLDKKTAALMQHVSGLEIAITVDEDQALLLESYLIKQYHPKYNILMRDDKSYPYLLLSEHTFPRLDYARLKRGTKSQKGRYFGPYPSAGSVRDNLALIQKLFQLRNCRDAFFNHRSRPCVQYQINRCTAPCVNYVPKEDYQAQVNNAILFLEGKNKAVLHAVKAQMTIASEKKEYEAAAHWRDVLARLKKLTISRRAASVAASRQWISISIADEFHTSIAAKQKQYENALSLLAEKLSLKNIKKIDCFDISHTSGQFTKASCVVFDEMGSAKKYYRQFTIDNITPGDDYAAMHQVLTRRYKKLTALPDVIIIDGGKGQLHQAASVMESLQISGVTLLGIAKGPTRKAGVEKLWLFGQDAEIEFSTDSPARLLLQQIRDEAHRFAITAHRKARGKNQLRSILDSIAGVGKKRKMDLLKHFGGLSELKKASVDDIACVKGISSVLAKRIIDLLNE